MPSWGVPAALVAGIALGLAASRIASHVSGPTAVRAAPTTTPVTSSSDLVKGGPDIHVPRTELEDVVSRCLVAAGASVPHATLVAQVLVAADCRGIPSHGVNRAEFYCMELQAGLLDGAAVPSLQVEGPSYAVVDGRNALGAVVSNFAMQVAIEKAKATGVAVVCVHHSNHYGIAGFWADMALREKLIGFSFTNTSPFMVPTRAKTRAAGTNPIACFCPALTDSFQLDMATTTVPVGKVEVCHRKSQGIPYGWGLDREGSPTQHPEAVFANGGLTPLGGMEDTAGYKGYGLCMLVEILTAVLPGDAAVGPEVQPWTCHRTQPLNYGHCFFVIDPKRFCGEAFEERLSQYLQLMRQLPPAEGQGSVLVPGDIEKAEERRSAVDGVRLNESVAASVKLVAQRYGVTGVPAAIERLSCDGVIVHTGVQPQSETPRISVPAAADTSATAAVGCWHR